MNSNQPNRNRKGLGPGLPFSFWYVLVAIGFLLVIQNVLFARPFEQLPYSDFKAALRQDRIEDVQISLHTIRGTLRPNTGEKAPPLRFMTVRVDDPELVQELEAHHVKYTGQYDSDLVKTLLSWIVPLVFLFVLWGFLSRRLGPGQGVMNFGKSRARIYAERETGVTFADVAGADEAKEELQEIIDFLRYPQKYATLGGRIPKGVLLVGSPGTGKTLLARAVAGEASVPFYSVAASEFVEMIVGVGASRVRDLFQKARAAAPAIIFIDELDAIGRSRSAGVRFGGNDEQEQTLNQILTEMDGFDSREGVIVLAATNRADVLDPALLRPGRFDRRVVVQPPDKAGRRAILKIHTRNVPLAPDVDLDSLAQQTVGMVGADLRNLVNEAALLAARKDRSAVTMVDFTESIEKVILGAERKIMLSEEDRERIAYHEGGHALLGLLLPGADPVRKVTIVPRGRALGVTVQSPVDDRFNYSEEYLRARIAGALGGRAAEQLVYGVVTTGAENDLQQVTLIAREMVVRWGMSPKVGPLNFD